MAGATTIEWTDATFNPWWGCAHVSAGCVNCYAEKAAARYGHRVWGAGGARRLFGDAHWAEPLAWDRAAQRRGRRTLVFCASMADVFEDHEALAEPRARLWELIGVTPWLVWQLLTKRPGNAARMAPWGNRWPANVWLGVSVEDQARAEVRIPWLLDIPATVRFVSAEPLLGPVDLADVDWVIVGGESGPRARPMDPGWARTIVAQCAAAGTACFVKQLGSVWARRSGTYRVDAKGGDPRVWPADLRVRELPERP